MIESARLLQISQIWLWGSVLLEPGELKPLGCCCFTGLADTVCKLIKGITRLALSLCPHRDTASKQIVSAPRSFVSRYSPEISIFAWEITLFSSSCHKELAIKFCCELIFLEFSLRHWSWQKLVMQIISSRCEVMENSKECISISAARMYKEIYAMSFYNNIK